jgi:hypothetical protein
MLLLLHRPLRDVMGFCAFEDIRDWCEVKNATGNNISTKGSETRKVIAYIPTDLCKLKLTLPHGLTLKMATLATVTLYEGYMEGFHFRDNSGNTIYVVSTGNRDSTASVLVELYELLSKQTLRWIGTLISMIPLASLSSASVSGQEI